jgi:type III secretion protein J
MRSVGGRVAAVAQIAALVALLSGCEATIASGLSEGQANAVVVALDGQGIGATKEASVGANEGWDVRVPNDDVGPALSVLRALDLPREPTPGLAEVFGEPTLVPTATEERARFVAAQSGELSRSLEGMEGVLGARVHLAIPEGSDFAFDEERPTPSASVLLRLRAGASVDEAAVQALVAGAVPQLTPDAVAVVKVQTEPVTPRQASLVHIGPIAVTQGSAPILKGVLGGALGLSALLAIALIISWMRLRRPRAETETPGTQAA